MNHQQAEQENERWLFKRRKWDSRFTKVVIHDSFKAFKKKARFYREYRNDEVHVWWCRDEPITYKGADYELE